VVRYFFHLENGGVFEDADGLDLPDLEAAKCAAVRLLAEVLCDRPARFWDTESCQVTCADERGLTLFTVQMIATLAPAAPERGQA
jgi:hypothetical protein